MDVIKIPFVAKVGMIRSERGELTLPFLAENHNHIQTMHASAQFSLAETASGEALLKLFPEMAANVLPVLRDSQIKFKKAALTDVIANAVIAADEADSFRQQLQKKGRSAIAVDVTVKDLNGLVTCAGRFNWFVQLMD